ncbi:MAG: MarR family transcriptional regulator [Bacteroidetes bacterium]|nr:MarR family transcriptional regulator [Bacteroidota bacterium]
MDTKLSTEFFEMYSQMKRRNVYRLVIRYGKYMAARAETIAHERGFLDFKIQYMGFLANIDSKGTTSSELARCIHVTKQATSKMVKEIEKLGYIEFRPHENDGRANVIHLTNKGEELLKLGITISEILKNDMVEIVGEDNVEHLIDTLQKLNAHVDDNQLWKELTSSPFK